MSGSYGAKEEIKMKTDIVALMSEYVRVKKSGATFMAVCPFHSEKTPSLHVSPDKGMWYCHGCGEGGDVFGFVMRMEGLDFMDAMRFLAKKAGVVLSEQDTKEQTERQLLMKVNGAAAKYYHEVLRKSPQAEVARGYVAKRKLTEQTVEEFALGFSPDSWDAVLNFLKSKGVTDEQAYRAGLVSKSDRGRGYYDRFRGRLMFPIQDHNGNVVGFTARVMPGPDGKDPKDEAKYINTSQTLIYNKSHVLYGLHAAKQEIKKKNLAVVVEGNMDVIATHQAGVRNVVASSGTSFTAEQLQLLKRFTDRLVLS
ncbi:MAG TPA: DNA primase, partial [Patescibacteria group bacterium]|nr:DNA primase [Patescibacteria group bacterium]